MWRGRLGDIFQDSLAWELTAIIPAAYGQRRRPLAAVQVFNRRTDSAVDHSAFHAAGDCYYLAGYVA